MKAIILAGGHATRLWPVTEEKAKPLLPLAGKPIIGYILDQIEDIEEVEKTYITTNKKFEDSFLNYLSDRQGNHELIVEEQESEDEKVGAVGGIINMLENHPEDDYIVIGGDNYYSLDLKKFINYSLNKDEVTIASFRVDSLEEATQYGVLDLDEENRVTDFKEKPQDPESRLVSTACYFFPQKRLDLFDRYVEHWTDKAPKDKFLDEPGRLIEWISENHRCYVFPFDGEWMDIGTREGYLKAESMVRDGNILEGEIKDTEIIGDNVTVLKNSRISNSEIENSIILENCVVENSTVRNSIIGEDTTVENTEVKNELSKGS